MTEDDRRKLDMAHRELDKMAESAIRNGVPGRFLAGVSVRPRKNNQVEIVKVVRESTTEQ